MMLNENAEGHEQVTLRLRVTDIQSAWIYETTFEIRIPGVELNIGLKIKPRKSMYIAAFGIWSNVFTETSFCPIY